MRRVHNFVVDLLRGSTSFKEGKDLWTAVWRKGSKMRANYKILKQIKEGKNTEDRRKLSSERTIGTTALIAAIITDV
jgi:hypothetical protein